MHVQVPESVYTLFILMNTLHWNTLTHSPPPPKKNFKWGQDDQMLPKVA